MRAVYWLEVLVLALSTTSVFAGMNQALVGSPMGSCDQSIEFVLDADQKKLVASAQHDSKDLSLKGGALVLLGNNFPMEEDLFGANADGSVSQVLRVYPNVDFEFKAGILVSAKNDAISFATDLSTPREYMHYGCNCTVKRDPQEWFGALQIVATGKSYKFRSCWFGGLAGK